MIELKITIRNRQRIVRCPQWKVAGFGGTVPVGDILLTNCGKCVYGKGLKDIFTYRCDYDVRKGD